MTSTTLSAYSRQCLPPSAWLAFKQNALFLCINLVGDPDSDSHKTLLREDPGDWFSKHWTEEEVHHTLEWTAFFWDVTPEQLETQTMLLLLELFRFSLGQTACRQRLSRQPSKDFTPLQNMILYGIAFGVSVPSPKSMGAIDPRTLGEDLPLSDLFPEGHAISAQDILKWSSDFGKFLPLCTSLQTLVGVLKSAKWNQKLNQYPGPFIGSV